MTTLAALADRAQNAIHDDLTVYSQAIIEEWVCDAIRDYSIHFPVLTSETIHCATGGHNYSLAINLIAVHLVEYPDGEDPPKYLTRKRRTDPDFFGSEGYYDVETSGEAVNQSQLWISEDPTTGEDIEVHYYRAHTPPALSTGTVTVPGHHEHLLILFVVWKAAVERMLYRVQRPDTTAPVLDQIRRAADSAHYQYQQAMAGALRAQSEGTITGQWEMDRFDRIY